MKKKNNQPKTKKPELDKLRFGSLILVAVVLLLTGGMVVGAVYPEILPIAGAIAAGAAIFLIGCFWMRGNKPPQQKQQPPQ